MTETKTITERVSDLDKLTPINTTENLAKALDEVGISYTIDDNGSVLATPEVVEYLNSKEALVPDTPVVRTHDELVNPQPEEDSNEDPGYEFVECGSTEEVQQGLDDGSYEIGQSTLKPSSPRHNTFDVYVGPIPELQGSTCLVKRSKDDPNGVACQFDNPCLVLNGRALGFGWHDFPYEHISDSRPFIDKWKDTPSEIRRRLRKTLKVPRMHPIEHRFLTPKEMRNGPKIRKSRIPKGVRYKGVKSFRNFLVNVICEDETESKSVVVWARSEEGAIDSARTKHLEQFPELPIKEVILNSEIPV